MSVIEMPEFMEHVGAVLSESERMALVEHLGTYPAAGAIVPGTGGVRKIRWKVAGRGKRGGARVIYYFYNESVPVFALDIYAKNEKDDLSEAEKRALRKLMPILVTKYMERRA